MPLCVACVWQNLVVITDFFLLHGNKKYQTPKYLATWKKIFQMQYIYLHAEEHIYFSSAAMTSGKWRQMLSYLGWCIACIERELLQYYQNITILKTLENLCKFSFVYFFFFFLFLSPPKASGLKDKSLKDKIITLPVIWERRDKTHS